MAPRLAKPIERVLPNQTLIIDNGAYTMKAGFATSNPNLEDCQVIPNCLAKDRGKHIWIGSSLEKCNDFGEIAFRRPVEKGFLVNWEAEKAIWDHTFFDQNAKLAVDAHYILYWYNVLILLKCDPRTANLILTEAPNTPAPLQTNCDQIIFEEYEFASYSRCLGPSLNAYHDIQSLLGAPTCGPNLGNLPAECLLVIDSGYSHSTVTPLFNGRPIQQAVRRLDVGGKFLTNYLKELISIRHYNMLDETYVMNEIKEAVCYVSEDFKRDLERTWKQTSASRKKALGDKRDIAIDYVLPDYNAHKSGYMRPHDPSPTVKRRKMGSMAGVGDAVEDYMTLANERFMVPELLFNPGDVGMKQEGLPATVLQSLSGLPPGLWPAMLANILVVGGNSKFEGFMSRLETEIRQLAPSECAVRIARAPDPIKSTWLGGAYLAANPAALKAIQVTREEYNENGSVWLGKVFSGAVRR